MTAYPENSPAEFDLIVSLPETEITKNKKTLSTISDLFGLLVNVGFVAPVLLAIGGIWVITVHTPALISAAGAFVILSVWFIHSYLKRRREERLIAPCQDKIMSEIEDKLGFRVTERPNLNRFPTDVIVTDKEGVESFLDIIKLDEEGHVGIRSRFRPQQ